MSDKKIRIWGRQSRASTGNVQSTALRIIQSDRPRQATKRMTPLVSKRRIDARSQPSALHNGIPVLPNRCPGSPFARCKWLGELVEGREFTNALRERDALKYFSLTDVPTDRRGAGDDALFIHNGRTVKST